MRRSLLTGVAVVATSGAFVALGAPSALASEHRDADDHPVVHQVVDVVGTGSAVQLSTTHLHTGSITFKVSTTNPTAPDGSGGSAVVMFRTKNGATVDKVLADAMEEFGGNAAQGTRDLEHDATFYGLADVTKPVPVTVTETLAPGTYHLLDFSAPPGQKPAVTTLAVDARRDHVAQTSAVRSQVTVKAVEPDRFAAPRWWPHKGTFTFTNAAKTLHFAALQRVKDGTTDAQVQAYFDSKVQTPPPFVVLGAPSVSTDVLSPGKSLQLTYDLPKGTYVLLCFVADDETGMPHAAMGMHKVVVLK